jgi:hypothetical protein
MRQRRHRGQQVRQDVLARDEQLDRLDPRRGGRVDEVLALADEEPGFVAVLALREPADERELRVGARGDQR